MANPKRKHSKSRTGKRRSTKKIKIQNLSICPNCNSIKPPHVMCPVCYYYKGTLVITPKEKSKEK